MSINFEELVCLSRNVNCHVYNGLTVITSDMLRYDKLICFNPYPANVKNVVSSNSASKWQMGFKSAFKVSIRNVRSPRSSYCSLQQLFAALLTQERVCVTKFAENNI